MRFRATLELHGKSATGIVVPPEVVEALGQGKKPPVKVTIGAHTYRSTIAPRGDRFLLPVSGENRKAAGVEPGDELEIELELDTEPRVVELPPDLAEALDAAPGARAAWDALSFSHQRAHVEPILAAKAPETRERRIAKSVAMLAG